MTFSAEQLLFADIDTSAGDRSDDVTAAVSTFLPEGPAGDSPLVGHLVVATELVVVVYLLSGSGVVVIEVADGAVSSIAFPLHRLAQVNRLVNADGSVSARFEVDASAGAEQREPLMFFVSAAPGDPAVKCLEFFDVLSAGVAGFTI